MVWCQVAKSPFVYSSFWYLFIVDAQSLSENRQHLNWIESYWKNKINKIISSLPFTFHDQSCENPTETEKFHPTQTWQFLPLFHDRNSFLVKSKQNKFGIKLKCSFHFWNTSSKLKIRFQGRKCLLCWNIFEHIILNKKRRICIYVISKCWKHV